MGRETSKSVSTHRARHCIGSPVPNGLDERPTRRRVFVKNIVTHAEAQTSRCIHFAPHSFPSFEFVFPFPVQPFAALV